MTTVLFYAILKVEREEINMKHQSATLAKIQKLKSEGYEIIEGNDYRLAPTAQASFLPHRPKGQLLKWMGNKIATK